MSIITVGKEEKRGVSSPIIFPDVAVLHAELTLGLPAEITLQPASPVRIAMV